MSLWKIDSAKLTVCNFSEMLSITNLFVFY